MSESKPTSGPQFRADHPEEQETVRTTIVGGRPPGSGQRLGPIPRGVEVVIKKASVDDQFKQSLLTERADAAKRIGLTLDPAEAMMLTAVPAEQLETIIAQTTVPQEHRRAFLGTAAAAMLAAVGLMSSGCEPMAPRGIAPDDPTMDQHGRPTRNKMGETGGAAPDEPPEMPAPQDGAEEPSEAVQDPERVFYGVRPDDVPAPAGIRPDPPDTSSEAASS
jgi:hypothetical protein